MDCELWIGGRR